MGFLGFTALAVAVLLTYAGVKGLSPVDSLRAFLRGEPQPAPKYLIQAAEPTAGRAGGFAGSNGIGVLLPAGQKLMRPVSPWRISSGFGEDRGDHLHAGVDVMVPTGTPIHAAAAGRVVAASWAGTAGIRTRIDHGSGLQTVYMHQSRLIKHTGNTVRQGEVIGLSGSTGRSSGPHLHFEVHVKGKPVNPAGYV